MTIVKYFRPVSYSCNGNGRCTCADDETMRDLYYGSRVGYALRTTPEANVFENEKEFRIEMAMPGIRKSNIKISLEKNVLSVTVDQQEHTEGTRTMKEYDFTTSQRSFILPDSVELDRIISRLENGILTIILPKKESEIPKGPTNIQIN